MDLKTMSTAELRALLEAKRKPAPAPSVDTGTGAKVNGHVVPIRSSITPLDNAAPPYSEEAMALYFATVHENHLKYVPAWNRWKIWDGCRWTDDQRIASLAMVREICRQTAEAYALIAKGPGGPKGIASNKTASGVLNLARSDPRLVATIDEWDRDDDLLNTPGGTIDLRTLQIRPHLPADYITRCTAVAPGGDCPMWMAFLNDVTAADITLQLYLRRLFGYALTGHTFEQMLAFLYGTGANGKSVIIDTISGIMGDYHRAAPIETFTASTNDRHPTELARLHGARLVTSVETEQGRRWAESRIKQLTGGDKVAARFMKQDFFEFVTKFKLIIAGNHKPGLRTVDEAIRRRMNLVPFAVTIPEEKRDEHLTKKLRAEWPGILQWLLGGCLEWRQIGLAPPDAVRKATDEYLESEDAISAWMHECCDQSTLATAGSQALYLSWSEWATKTGEFVGSQKRLSETLESRGFEKKRSNTGQMFIGLALKPREQSPWYDER